jgi:hypothetical protein
VWVSNLFYCENLAQHISNVFCGKNVKVLVLSPAVRMLTTRLYRVNKEATRHEDVWGIAGVVSIPSRPF